MQKYWVNLIHGVFDKDEYKEELQAEIVMARYANHF